MDPVIIDLRCREVADAEGVAECRVDSR